MKLQFLPSSPNQPLTRALGSCVSGLPLEGRQEGEQARVLPRGGLAAAGGVGVAAVGLGVDLGPRRPGGHLQLGQLLPHLLVQELLHVHLREQLGVRGWGRTNRVRLKCYGYC